MSLARILYARLLLRLAISGYAMADAYADLARARFERACQLIERA